MWLRKERGGSGAAGYSWEHDGDVVEVPDHLALELLEVPGNDFTLVEPEDLEPDGSPDAAADKPKRPYRRRTETTTEVAE